MPGSLNHSTNRVALGRRDRTTLRRARSPYRSAVEINIAPGEFAQPLHSKAD